jgi:hypothetical protein
MFQVHGAVRFVAVQVERYDSFKSSSGDVVAAGESWWVQVVSDEGESERIKVEALLGQAIQARCQLGDRLEIEAEAFVRKGKVAYRANKCQPVDTSAVGKPLAAAK